MVAPSASPPYRFGIFEADAASGELRKAGIPLHLQPQPSLVLLMLLRHAGQMVTREQLRESIWAEDTFVEFDDGLNHAISKLREALGDSAQSPLFIETIPRRGYRFIAPVEHGSDSAAAQGTPIGHWPLSAPEIEPTRMRWRKRLVIVAILLVTVLGTVIVWLSRSKRTQPHAGIPNIIRLTNSGHVEHAAISPDGKYLAFVQSEGPKQSVWLQQIATSVAMRILDPAPVTYASLVFSPDGSYLYYTQGEPDPGPVYKSEPVPRTLALYRLAVLGGAPHKLLADMPERFGISPDGKAIAYVHRDLETGDSNLVLARIDGSARNTIATRRGKVWFGEKQGASWSPDGKLLAVIEVTLTPVFQCSLVVIQLNGGRETMRVPVPTRILQPQWLGDGSGLIAPVELWHLQVWEISYPEGQTRAITQDLTRYSEVSLPTNSESLVAVQMDELSSIWVGPANDPDRARPITPLGGHYIGVMGLNWTPAGQVLFFSSAKDTHDFVLLDPESGSQRIIPLGRGKWYPEVCPDGRTLVYVGLYPEALSGVPTLLRSDLHGSSPQPLATKVSMSSPRCSPDGKWVVYAAADKLWKVPLNGGAALPLADRRCENPAISRDGQWIGCRYWPQRSGPPKLGIVPFSGGAPVKIFDLLSPDDQFVAWTPDDRGLAMVHARGGAANIWVQPVSGAPRYAISHFSGDEVWDFAWSFDGKQIATTRGNATTDAVLITKFH